MLQKIQHNAIKYFNRLVIFAQMENNLEIILRPIPMSLFSQKDQMVCDGDKSSFA